MTEPPTPAEVMLEATKSTLRTGRMGPAQVTRHQLDALIDAGYVLRPLLDDGGAALLLATAKRAFWSGRFRPADVIALQLEELAAEGHVFEFQTDEDVTPCDEFVWGPNSFDSCEECGLSFWRHGEGGTRDTRTHHRSES
ncbi:MAG: hypothetical protein H0T54_04620 [Geodermatophilaceae bacterium]|nr:hypothetical protein [Geodermatophilaceae bacterium]